MSTARRSRFRRILGALLVVMCGVVTIVGALFVAFGRTWIAHGVVDAPNAGKTFRPEDDPSPAECRKMGVSEHLRVDVGAPPASLSIWMIEPNDRPRGTVLVLHGIRSDKSWFVGQARQIAAEGYRVVLPDLRGHGRSSGDWLSYGVREAPDLAALLDWLEACGRLFPPIGVVGTSYGAAVGIQLAGLDPRIEAVVGIAPFSSLRAVVPGYVRHYVPGIDRLIPEGFIQAGIDEAGRLGGFDPSSASPLLQLPKARAHVLLIHGLADDHIPFAQSVALRDVAPAQTELVLVAGDDHFSIVGDRSGAIAKQGMAWLHRWLDVKAPPPPH
jgi:pimeloyl-ACP methyl ester carboxylesterase